MCVQSNLQRGVSTPEPDFETQQSEIVRNIRGWLSFHDEEIFSAIISFFLFDNEFYSWFQNEKHKTIMLLRPSTLKGQSDLKVYLKLLQFSMHTGVCKSL